MQAKTLRQADGQSLVLEHARIVSPQQAEDLGKDEALQRCDVILHQEAFNSALPLSLK
jgi:hypothetical protein